MSTVTTIVVGASAAFVLIWVIWQQFHTKNSRLFAAHLGGLALYLFFLHFVVGFFKPEVSAKGTEDQPFLAIVVALYVCMILGMMAEYGYQYLDPATAPKPQFEVGTLIRPLLISPMILMPLVASLQTAHLDLSHVDGPRLMVFLVAFENGFLWRGYRTELDAIESERREITETRFTSIDRRFLSDASDIRSDLGANYFAVIRNPVQDGLSERARVRTQHEASRLALLGRMGLAESTGPNCWRVRRDFDQVLKAMQRTTDRQKTLAAHGVMMSDNRLAIEVLDVAKMAAVEGRVLVHGQDEQSGRNYMMLEGTDAKVYLINYTPEMEMARSRGELRTNSFVRLRKQSMGRAPIDVDDLGDAEGLLRNTRYLSATARQLLMRGIMPAEDGWGGWLGRYQAALREAALEMAVRANGDLVLNKERRRDRSRGR